jgi:hypothetical protein
VMQDGVGRLWTSLGQAPALQMAWRRLPVSRSDMGKTFFYRVPMASKTEPAASCLSRFFRDGKIGS